MNATPTSRKTRWLARLGVALVWLLGITWRIRFRNDAAVKAARRERHPLVFVLWHGQLLPQLWAHRGQGINVLISEHRDGEIIARITRAFGFGAVRGSTSRGANRALGGLARAIEAGVDVAITPDGPRGPAHSFAVGPLLVAQRTGCPLVPVGVAVSRAWHLKSWDRFTIPKPFARITVCYGSPITIAERDARVLESQVAHYAAVLDTAVAAAEA